MIPNIVFPAPHGRFVLKKHNLQTKFPLDTLLLYRKTILVQNEPIMNEKELQTRKVIIETARNLFRQYGYEKTSIDQIAKAAHKAKGSVYYHFKGKEEVFKSALEEELDHLKHILIDVIQNPSFSIENRFEQYIIRRMECLHDAYAYHITLMQDLSVNGSTLPSVIQLRKDFEQWEHDIMMRLTEEGIKTMQLQDIQPEIMADLIKMLVKGLEIQFFVQNKYDSYSPTFQMLIKRVTRGFVSATPSMTNN